MNQFAQHLPDAPSPQAVSVLKPNHDVQPIAQQMQNENRRIMLVGHLPFLQRLASLLIAGDANAAAVTLDAGALLALAKSESGWSVVSLMQPKLLPGA